MLPRHCAIAVLPIHPVARPVAIAIGLRSLYEHKNKGHNQARAVQDVPKCRAPDILRAGPSVFASSRQKLGCLQLNDKLIRQFGNKVLHGPFSGIVLSPEARREHLAPFLLGTYERELHPVWSSVFQMKFAQILDVGAKFGFYAIGLAQRFPGVPVFAFDTDPWARKATRQMCAANQLTIQVLGLCNPDWMHDNLQQNAFILSDCEGYEATLFGSVEIPNLSSATMLIELHEQFSPGVTRLLQSNYSRSHDLLLVTALLEAADLPAELAFLDEPERKTAVSEFRTTQQSWLFLKPKI